MKARCHREGLLTACQTAMAVLPTRTTSPILRKIHFNVEDPDVGVLLATDLDQALRYRVSGVTTTQAGKVLLPTQELVAILRELSDEFVEISSTDSGLKIAGSSSQVRISRAKTRPSSRRCRSSLRPPASNFRPSILRR